MLANERQPCSDTSSILNILLTEKADQVPFFTWEGQVKNEERLSESLLLSHPHGADRQSQLIALSLLKTPRTENRYSRSMRYLKKRQSTTAKTTMLTGLASMICVPRAQ